MRLFETMLKGAKNSAQVFGTWSDGNGGTCAMGAIMLGCGLKTGINDWYESLVRIKEQFPELLTQAYCPEDECFSAMRLMDVIMHLNDFHHWSRQRIAEWLSGSKITAPQTNTGAKHEAFISAA